MPLSSNAISVVTGGTSGIGLATVEALARRGARVFLCGRSADRIAEVVRTLDTPRVSGHPCDVADPDAVTRFAGWVRATAGPPRILVNNAGLGHLAPLTELTLDQIDETFAVNVRGIFLMTRAFLPDMLQAGHGHIINVASLAGRNGFVGGTAYAASKHAVLGFSKSLMLEVRERGVRVSAVCPGSVRTDFFNRAGMPRDDLDRVLQPEDVAASVLHIIDAPERAIVSEIDLRPRVP